MGDHDGNNHDDNDMTVVITIMITKAMNFEHINHQVATEAHTILDDKLCV
jgi:hypothetical protein